MMSSFSPAADRTVTTSGVGRFVSESLPGMVAAGAKVFVPAGSELNGRAEEQEDVWPSVGEASQEAYARGFAAGRRELPWDDARALRGAAGVLRQAARRLVELRRDYLRSHRRVLVDLVFCVAEKVLRHRVESDPDALAGVVEQALEALGPLSPVTLQMSQPNHAVLLAGLSPELEALASEHGLQVEIEAELEPGDLRLVADSSEVDARIPEVLRRLREGLTSLLDVDEDVDEVEP